MSWGALHAITHELITVTNATYINAQSVCELLGKIAQMNFKTPVSLILDNARYQQCSLVKDLAAQLNIELVFLPAYSPNLNLIERLWKFVKKQCLYSKYYPEFVQFKNAIMDCLQKTCSGKTGLSSVKTFPYNLQDILRIKKLRW